MICSHCNVTMVEGEPDVEFSTYPLGVKALGKNGKLQNIGRLGCLICPDCGTVIFKIDQNAKEKLAKITE